MPSDLQGSKDAGPLTMQRIERQLPVAAGTQVVLAKGSNQPDVVNPEGGSSAIGRRSKSAGPKIAASLEPAFKLDDCCAAYGAYRH